MKQLLQLRVLGLGFLQDGDVGVGVFPEREKLRRGGRVGLSDLTRSEILPKDLDGLLAWVACIGDAQSVEGYVAYLKEDGFSVGSIQQQNDSLKEMVDQIRRKLLGAEIMAGLKKLRLPVVDLGAAKRMASSAMVAVKQGQLGYALICATKHARL